MTNNVKKLHREMTNDTGHDARLYDFETTVSNAIDTFIAETKAAQQKLADALEVAEDNFCDLDEDFVAVILQRHETRMIKEIAK